MDLFCLLDFRLKLGNTFQYTLNAKGSTPAEVLGIDYKSTLKPLLDSFSDDIKKSSMVKLEELISLQQESVDLAAKIEAKRNRIALLQTHIDEVSVKSRFAPYLAPVSKSCDFVHISFNTCASSQLFRNIWFPTSLWHCFL